MGFSEESELLGRLVPGCCGDCDGLVDDDFVVLGSSLFFRLGFCQMSS